MKDIIFRISAFLNYFMNQDLLNDILYPQELNGDYEDFSEEEKRKWYLFTFKSVFNRCCFAISRSLSKELSDSELLFINERVEAFIKTCIS